MARRPALDDLDRHIAELEYLERFLASPSDLAGTEAFLAPGVFCTDFLTDDP